MTQISFLKLIGFFWILLLPFSWCLEEYQREIFLAPRHFNPHPYEQLARIQDPGPVVFPSSQAEEAAINNRYNIITVDANRQKLDDSPYNRVTQKIKYLINRKYNIDNENQIDSNAYEALAEQGARVLNYPVQELKSYPKNAKKNYAFAYKVLDKATGDDFSHQQVRSSKATNGEYRVKLPDGRLQIVSYKADKNGYKADVRYEIDPEANQVIQAPVVSRVPQYVPQKVEVSQVPVRELIPRGKVKAANSYDFIADEEQPLLKNPIVVLEQSGPMEIPVNYVDVAIPQAVSNPSYLSRESGHHNPNVQVYTRNHLQNSYIPTTATQPVQYEKQIFRYTSTAVPPTVQAQIIHNGDHGLYNPNVVSSTYAPPARPPPGHKNVINTLAPANNQNDAYRQTLEQENDLPEGIYIVGKTGKRK